MSDSDLEKIVNKGGKEENKAQRKMSEELQNVAKNLESQQPLESGRSKQPKPKVFTGANPFQDLAKDEEGIAGIQAQVEKERKRTLQERFGEILEGKFDQFPSAKFETELNGADSLTIIKAGQPGELNLHIIVSWTEDGEKKNRTFSLTEDGKMIPDTSARSAWKALSKVGQKTGKNGEKTGGITKELLLDEVLRIAEKVNPGLYISYNGPMLPSGVAEPGEEDLGGGPGIETGGPAVNERKLEILDKHGRTLFAFCNEKEGLNGYRAVVYSKCIVLSRADRDNAAYMFVFKECGLPNINNEGVNYNLPPERRMVDEQQRREIVKKYWEDSLGKFDKTQARKLPGVVRMFHSGNWERNIPAAIDKIDKGLNNI